MYYKINETMARQAKEANSYSDYVDGSATAEYKRMVDEAARIAQRQKAKVDPIYHEKISSYLDLYARKLADNMNHGFAIDTRVASVLIAGPSNFPIRKKEKQNAARDSNMREWQEIDGLLDKIKGIGTGGISADDPNAVEKLKKKLARMEEEQMFMKNVNAYYRKHKTLDGCELFKDRDAAFAAIVAGMSRSWRADPMPFEGWVLSNNNANIRRVRERINDLENRDAKGYQGWKFDGGEVVINMAENRLQVMFDSKPEESIRGELKGGGFKWAPSQGAWQRQLTDNAIHAAKRMKCLQTV